MYIEAGPDPNPNPRGGGQLPNTNECNSTLTSGTSGAEPHLNRIYWGRGSTTKIFTNDRGHRFRSGSPLTNYPHASTT